MSSDLAERSDRQVKKMGRPRVPHENAWSIKDILAMSLEERGKQTQEAWQEMEVAARRLLRRMLHSHKANGKTKELKELAVAAQICHGRAYPGQELTGMQIHMPAHLLRAVSERILRSIPQPVDVTPEPLVEMVVESEVNQEKSTTS